MTDGEKRLWRALQDFRPYYRIHFRKQAPIGPFVVDFIALKYGLVVEVDGEFHAEPGRREKDARRDAYLGRLGFRVLRFNTGELAENFDGCLDTVLRELGIG